MKSKDAKKKDVLGMFMASSIVEKRWRDFLPTDRVAILTPRGTRYFLVGHWRPKDVVRRLCEAFDVPPTTLAFWLKPNFDGSPSKIVKLSNPEEDF